MKKLYRNSDTMLVSDCRIALEAGKKVAIRPPLVESLLLCLRFSVTPLIAVAGRCSFIHCPCYCIVNSKIRTVKVEMNDESRHGNLDRAGMVASAELRRL